MNVSTEMVPDVLAEKIGNLRRAGQIHAEQGVPRRQVREETVSIRSDADLHAFVARLLEILKDGRSREEIEKGRWVFRLGAAPGTGEQRGMPASAAPCLTAARIEPVWSRAPDRESTPGTTSSSSVSMRDAAGVGSAARARHLAEKEPGMITGRVKGRYWSTKRVTTLPQGALLDVELENGSHLVAFDPLGCGEGELVLIIQGSVAASYFENVRATVDALIVGSLDEEMQQTSGKIASRRNQ
jgi:ethanolamine utilization protein EutN